MCKCDEGRPTLYARCGMGGGTLVRIGAKVCVHRGYPGHTRQGKGS